MNIIHVLKTKLSRWDSTFFRFPISILFFAVLTILTLIYQKNPTDNEIKGIMCLYILALSSLLCYIIKENYSLSKWPFILSLFLSFIGVTLLWFYLPLEKDVGQVETPYIYGGILFIFHILFFIVPFFKSKSEFNFLNFGKKIIFDFLFSALLALILYLFSILIILAFDKLFDVHFQNNIYFQLLIFIFGIFHTVNFLSSFPPLPFQVERTEESNNKRLSFFLNYILIPIVLIYGFIILAYIIKIFIQKIPLAPWLNVFFAWYFVTGIIAFYLSKSLLIEKKGKLLTSFTNYWPSLTLPILIFSLYAVYASIKNEGWYPETYYLAILFTILFLFLMYYVVSVKKDLRHLLWMLIVGTLITILSGPINIWNLTQSSQELNVIQELKSLGIINHEGKMNISENTLIKSENLSKQLNYLKYHGNIEFIYTYTSNDPLISQDSLRRLIDERLLLGIYIPPNQEMINLYQPRFDDITTKQMGTISSLNGPSFDVQNLGYAVIGREDGNIYVYKDGSEVLRFTLQSDKIINQSYDFENNDYHIMLSFNNLYGTKKDNIVLITDINGVAFIIKK